MTRDIKDIITDMREIVKPYVAQMLFNENFEGKGNTDKAEFETEFEMLLTFADRGASVEPCEDAVSREAVLITLDSADKVLDENRTVENYKDLLKECIEQLLPVKVEPQEWISPTVEPVSVAEAKKLLYQEFKDKMKDGNPRLLVAYEIAMKALEQTEWIPVTERLPVSEEEVEICAIRKFKDNKRYIITTAMYEDGTVRDNDSSWNWENIDWAGWDDEEDCGIIPQGWWEYRHYNPDDVYNNLIDDFVVAWRPLPEPYKGDTE